MTKREKITHAIYISAVAILLLATIILSYNLFWKKGDDLTDHQKYYQAKCNAYSVQNFNASKGQIIFIGDSITDLYPLDDYYADLDLATYNRGIGGDTTSGVLDRLKVSLFDLAPTRVVLLIGTNDINGGVSKEQIFENYRKIIKQIRENLPDTELYCVSVIPQNKDLEAYSSIKVDTTTPVILEMNEQIKEIIKDDSKITYVDLFSRVADENNMLIKEYSDDGIHLNKNGFEVWTSLIKPYFE